MKDCSQIAISVSSPALYNLFVIFVSTVLSLWIIRVSKRLYRVFRVRAAILAGRLVHTWAVSSALPYFEGAIQAHIDAIVQTRQSYPPTHVTHEQYLHQYELLFPVWKEASRYL
jgi:hypothetical protein